MLSDPRLKDGFRKRLEQQAQEQTARRPDWAGYSREVQTLHAVNVTATRILQAVTRNYSIPLPAAPLTLAEELGLEQAAEDLASLDDDIATAMGRRGS